MDDLLLRQKIACHAEGDLVVLTVGNSTLKIDYETALKLSQWMRISGKEAKRFAGDVSQHWSVIGLLDAEK